MSRGPLAGAWSRGSAVRPEASAPRRPETRDELEMRDERHVEQPGEVQMLPEMQVGIERPPRRHAIRFLHAAWEDQPCPSLDEIAVASGRKPSRSAQPAASNAPTARPFGARVRPNPTRRAARGPLPAATRSDREQ